METMGFEPTTPCLQSRCSSQLSYVPGTWSTVQGTMDRAELRRRAGWARRWATEIGR